MFKIAALIFVVAAPTLMGILAVAVLSTPSLMNDGAKWISVAAGLGFLLSIPVSYFIAKSIQDAMNK